MGVRPWITFSSSSGETFRACYDALTVDAKSSLKAFFTDRPCGALEVARSILPPHVEIIELPRKRAFEEGALAWMESHKFLDGLVFLCGFFGILSGDFLEKCGSPVVNTHPSLLPAFPGLDEKVHKAAFEQTAISGFTVHLVNESLDGGPIAFQHPVALDALASGEQNRAHVRAAEQKWLPRVLDRLLRTRLTPADRSISTLELRRKHELRLVSFEDRKDLAP